MTDNSRDKKWCELSERRLLLKLVHHKPTGIQRHGNIQVLVDYMNHIFEDEQDISFEEYLSENDLELLRARRANKTTADIMVFPPIYSIRPTGKEIETKLNEYYDMELIHESEPIPTKLLSQSEFKLPSSYITSQTVSESRIGHPAHQSAFLSLIMNSDIGRTGGQVPIPIPVRKRRRSGELSSSTPSRSSTPNPAKRLKSNVESQNL